MSREHDFGPWLPGADCGVDPSAEEQRCKRCPAKRWRHGGSDPTFWYGNKQSEAPCPNAEARTVVTGARRGSRLVLKWFGDPMNPTKQGEKAVVEMMRELKAAGAVQVSAETDAEGHPVEVWEIPAPAPVKPAKRKESVVERGLRTGKWPAAPSEKAPRLRRSYALHRNG